MRYILRDEDSRTRLKTLIDSLADKAWEVEIKPYSRGRTGSQNDRFHALISLVATETGNDPAWLKEWAKNEFGILQCATIAGVPHEIPKSTARYTVAEMSQLMDRFEAWAAQELGIAL